MKVTYQTIEYDANLPVCIRVRDGPGAAGTGEPHWHKEPELVYIDSGELTVTAGMNHSVLKAGDVAIINSDEVHRLSGNARYLCVDISYGFIRQLNRAIDRSDFVTDESSQAYRELVGLMQKLLAAERSNNDAYIALKKYSVLMKLLRLLLTRCISEKQVRAYGAGKSFSDDAAIVKDYIEAHYREKISLSDVAGQLGRNTANFSVGFKKLTGSTFRDYLISLRTRRALDDLVELDISVNDAALRNGFPHCNAFAVACRNIYGKTPVQLKKQRQAARAAVSTQLDKTA